MVSLVQLIVLRSLSLAHLLIQYENQLLHCYFPYIRNRFFVKFKCWDLIYVPNLMASSDMKTEDNHPPCLSIKTTLKGNIKKR